MMRLGYGSSEEFGLQKGRVLTDILGRLDLRQITDAPEILVLPIEEGARAGPFGSKRMGELPVARVAPAVVNAICDAGGVRITSLPIAKEKVLAALRARGRR